jgi:hypothetical protein
MKVPVWVISRLVPFSRVRARPRSMIFSRWSPLFSVITIRLSGERSRWTMPAAWMAPRPRRPDGQLEAGEHREGAAVAQPVAHVLPLDVLGDHVEAAVRQPVEVVEDGDVGVLDLGRQARLAREAGLGRRIGGQVLAQDLDHPQLLQVDVTHQVDLSHPTAAQALDDLRTCRRGRSRFPLIQSDLPLRAALGGAYCALCGDRWPPPASELFQHLRPLGLVLVLGDDPGVEGRLELEEARSGSGRCGRRCSRAPAAGSGYGIA